MPIQTRNHKQQQFFHIVLCAYWIVLLVWQNIRSTENRSGADVLIKMALLLFLVGYYFLKKPFIYRTNSFFLFVAVAVLTVVTFFSDASAMSLSKIISYVFPLLFFFVTILHGDDVTVNKKQFLVFLRIIIVAVLYLAIYAMFFAPDQFRSALSASSAYGHELTSFLVSNMEYGMYLAFGILSCILCLELDTSLNTAWKLVYAVIIAVFAVNLILTFSRTSIIATLVILLVFIFTAKKSRFRSLALVALIVGIVVIASVPALREFVLQVVFKENNASGRDVMLEGGLEIFSEQNNFQKMFGMGISTTGEVIFDNFDHRSTHNAYLQMLLSNGIVGAGILISILVWNLISNIRAARKDHAYRYLPAIFAGFVVAAAVYMMTTTCTLFYSNIDAYFLSMMAIIVPKYVRNAIDKGVFEEAPEPEKKTPSRGYRWN